MEQLEIFVESLTGSLLQFQVSPFETVLSLKEKIQNLQGIPVNHQHLVHQDRELDNDSSLYNYNIQTGSTLRLILHMRGGPISTRPLTADLTSQQTLLEEMATEYMESLTGENWPSSGNDGGSVASGISGDSETQTDARAPSTASASPTPVPPSSQSHPRHVTLLVLRDGDQLNFYRVVDRSTSCIVPNGSSVIAPFDAMMSPSASAIPDDQSSAASDATFSGFVSAPESSAPLFGKLDTSNTTHNITQAAEEEIHDQRVIEDKTRQKMAELRSRMMANSKQVQITPQQQPPHNSGAAVVSGLNTTPVMMPRPPSTVQRVSVNASRNAIQDAPRPYVPTAMSSLRRRRVTNQQSLPVPSSPPKGTMSSPREQLPVPSNGNNFASLADYFRSKEESGGNQGPEGSPPPLPSPLHSKTGKPLSAQQLSESSRRQQFSQTQAQPAQPQDVVRCSPYLRELFAGTRFFVMDQDEKEGDNATQVSSNATETTSIKETIHPPPSAPAVKKSSPMQLKTTSSQPHQEANKSIPDPSSYEHLIGESVIQHRFGGMVPEMAPPSFNPPRSNLPSNQMTAMPSRTTSRQQQPQQPSVAMGGSRPSGLANAFAALIEHQASQPATTQQHGGSGFTETPSRKPTGLGNSQGRGPPQQPPANPDGDVDVLERALTTLLLKAELEHLGSSRLPASLIQPAGNSDPLRSSQRFSNQGSSGMSAARFGGASNSRGQQSTNFAIPNRAPPTPSKTKGSISLSSNDMGTKRQSQPLGLELVPPQAANAISATTKLPVIAPPHQSQSRPAAVAPVTRCAVCNRRTGLATTYICRCAATFCTVHRYPETHQCTYDYKGEGRRAIQANNPVITADKLPKI